MNRLEVLELKRFGEKLMPIRYLTTKVTRIRWAITCTFFRRNLVTKINDLCRIKKTKLNE